METGEREHFHGRVGQELVHEHQGVVRVLKVLFEAGALTDWHMHEGGQVLHVMEGEGLVQSWGGGVREIHAGDLCVAAAGEKHWHGAGPHGPMTHLAVSVGITEWLEPVSAE